MNTAKLDFKRFCVLVCILFLSSFVYAAADTLPVAADFSKTQTQNSAVYFSPDDFKSNVTAEDGEVTAIKLMNLPDRGSLTYQGAPVSEMQEIPIENAGELLYTPEQDAVYTTTFQYQAKTTGQYSKAATISVSITDVTSGPLRVENASITTKKNTPVSSTLIGHSETELSGQPEFMIVDAPTKGKVDVTDVHSGAFTYTPFTDQTGEDSFTFKLVFSPYESEPATVTITIEDTPETSLFQYADLGTHWAAYSAAMLVERNITIGEKIGNQYYYHPDKQLTRGDFVLLLTAAVGLDSLPEYTGSARFADEDEMPSYLIEPAYRAMEAGIINGIADGDKIYFGANNSLTRVEAFVMVNNAINPNYESTIDLDFADVNDIPLWAVQAIKNMEGYGLIKGFDDNTLRPFSLIQKAQGGEVVYQFVKYLDAYPEARAKLCQNFTFEAQPISYNVQKGYISSSVH